MFSQVGREAEPLRPGRKNPPKTELPVHVRHVRRVSEAAGRDRRKLRVSGTARELFAPFPGPDHIKHFLAQSVNFKLLLPLLIF